MRLLALVLASLFDLLRFAHGLEFMVTRHSNGDIFTFEGTCTETCTVLSSGTSRSLSSNPSTLTLSPFNTSCSCQCNDSLPIFREDLQICVNDIHECSVAGFISNSGLIERVPYVFLPQRGQIIYPHAEIRFKDVTTPVCGITGARQLGKSGWSELRNLSNTEPPFRLFRDEGRTFLQWIGESGLRDAAEGRVVIANLICRDASPRENNTAAGVFAPCVAFRVAGSPSRSNVREIIFSSNSQVSRGLSATEYAAIGLSSVILAIIYVASVSLYLHSRRGKRKSIEEPELTLPGPREGVANNIISGGFIKNNPLLITSRHLENDTNSVLTENELGDELVPSDEEQNCEHSQFTSAIIHPRYVYLDHSETVFGSGSMLGERLPEEDVRIVETVDSSHQQEVPVLPGTQRRKLYFNPAYFDRQLLLSPPPAAIEFLLKIREVISIAKHKMAAKKFLPTLVAIPEEESDAERSNSTSKQKQLEKSISSSSQNVATKSTKSAKSLRCTGCPGCANSYRNLAIFPRNDQPSPGESKVRAWLEDVKPNRLHWLEKIEQEQKNCHNDKKTFVENFEYVKELAKCDFLEFHKETRKCSFSWQDNSSIFRISRNVHQPIARSEIIENDDRYSVFSKRSTKSMFENSSYIQQCNSNKDNHFIAEDIVNEKVRKAIENSFIKQMEENAAIEKKEEVEKVNDNKVSKRDVERDFHKKDNNANERITKSKGGLPDMINELPATKNRTKRIMDAVIREMVDAKVLEHYSKSVKMSDYEVDSLERLKYNRKSSTSPESIDQSSPTLSTALPLDEELTIQNAVINGQTGESVLSKLKKNVLEKNYYNALPELIVPKSEVYSLVSEVYVNDGYVSPAGSDDSAPDIQYEPENPGHLTIKVQDSPDNYVKQDESEYEPDTLDRKPMKLKINDEISTEKEMINEIFMDSLERPAQILLKSKGSFRNDDNLEQNDYDPLERRGYGSLREIYEAKLRSNLKESSFLGSSHSLNGDISDNLSWKKKKYLTPEKRQAKRQRQANFNQPDVVPLPPTENIYQSPKAPIPVEGAIKQQAVLSSSSTLSSKNGLWDRNSVEAVDPTASNGSPVQSDGLKVGYNNDQYYHRRNLQKASTSLLDFEYLNNNKCSRFQEHLYSATSFKDCQNDSEREKSVKIISDKSSSGPTKIEDNGYLSSTDSNSSRKQLLKSEVSSVSETDETESFCDGASESGAESIGTDSVFFGNLQRISEATNSGVQLKTKDSHCRSFDHRIYERTNFNLSDSETESFVTVLLPNSNLSS
ncbi:PREDICTED: uncharacterized protein LOC106790993 [Polistes canadensis]|uniref:uncharacterized protein LOC106790993 n=1 Tax=Polistes canadensis TaxID=91411 RepID=UPI000718C78F|nr:PREDICTED: uncharacterized protein LOC106790993 [Polistes canadensis]XP_014611783.1 PREDICTED: uncharacterized protein LOC106790993 [Polistes canadensis]